MCHLPKEGGRLHLVQTIKTGELMLSVSQKLQDKSFFRRLNSITTASDAIANDVVYHNLCWADAKKKASPKLEQSDNYSQTMADIELIYYVESCLANSKMLDMNNVNETYKNILMENGTDIEKISSNYKKYLKSLISENVKNAVFVKHQQKNRAEQIIADVTQSQLISQLADSPTDADFQTMWKVAKRVRKEMLDIKWKFHGELDNFVIPQILQTFLKWVLIGPQDRNNATGRSLKIETMMSVISQLVFQSVKSEKQVHYQTNNEVATVYQTIETPLNVGIGLFMYHSTRSRKLVKFLADLNISISYEKVIEIKKSIAASIYEKRKQNNGIFIPSSLTKNKPLYFAIDNTDMRIDTVDGKNQLHGTAIAVYQQIEDNLQLAPLSIKRGNNNKEKGLQFGYEKLRSFEPAISNLEYFDYRLDVLTDTLNFHSKGDTVWAILKSVSVFSDIDVPTWAGYNSLITDSKPKTLVQQLPIINGSPTKWENLHSAIAETEKLRSEINPNGKTIVSFDLQLYAKAIRLQVEPSIKNNYIFRMGELHVVFTVLKVLGKVINGSGLDQAFEEAEIYGSTVMGQIQDGKHLYRALEAHFTLYLALHKLYVDKIIEANPVIERIMKEDITNIIQNLQNYRNESKEAVISYSNECDKILTTINFQELKKQFDEKLVNQAKFYRSYMMLFENLLLFIRGSRQQLWLLHLNSLHNLCSYFFAYDMLNYARLTPVYLSQMFQLKVNDPETWQMFENGGFSVNKTDVSFSAIGADHALEQENRAVKVLGGIKGITNNEKALEEYFLTSAEMSNIVTNFCSTFSIPEISTRKREEHYQLSGSKNTRLKQNVKKMLDIFELYGVTFSKTNEVFNILTKKVLPAEYSGKFLSMKTVGEQKYMEFINERLCGKKSIWDTMKKVNLPTFASNNSEKVVTVNKQLINLKEERKLMSRFVIAARTRPEIDLPTYLGTFEFSVVPKSLFMPDGSLRLCSDKSSIAKEIKKLQQQENSNNNEKGDPDICERNVIIFDGMSIVNKIDIKKWNLRSCSDFAESFIRIIKKESRDYHEVRIIFDRYVSSSLKWATREKRTNGVCVKYKISDETKIEHLTTKQFLANIETKNDLTEYLATKIVLSLQVDYVIVYGNVCKSNMIINSELYNYSQEEADTGIVLHALDVSRRNPFSNLVISCTDTDVLLILLYYFHEVCSSCTFKTRDSVINLRSVYECLGANKCKALLGFHSFTGCDQTGKFSGHSKLSSWKTFISSNSDIIDAFRKLGEDLTSEVIANLEDFVIDLYCKNRPLSVKTVADLRWHLFSKFQYDSEKLPPTSKSLQQKILRSHYTSLVWKSSHIPSPSLPSPEEYGWMYDKENNTFKPIMTTNPPAPETIIELSICKCKTGCDSQRCKCWKSGLLCSEMCMCDNCNNDHVGEPKIDSDTEIEDYD